MTLHSIRLREDWETVLVISMGKVFGVSFTASGSRQSGSNPSAGDKRKSSGKKPIAEIKLFMSQCMHDMPGIEAERLRYKITAARSVPDLWLLRSDMYQTIAMLQNQSEAALRINSLLVLFAHWLPAQQLVKI
jgi:hypothetical protein